MIRVTFVGDIALDKPLLRAAKERGKGAFDFSDVFHTRDVFAKSNLVVGNLETVFGGGRRFNKKPYHYNSPDSFCKAIKDAGINLVGTANNHCMDEGVSGIKRTNTILDECGILHTGSYFERTEDRFLIKEINGVKLAFYALTYSVNGCMESQSVDTPYKYVNLIGFRGNNSPWIEKYYRYIVKSKLRQVLLKIRKRSTIAEHTDSLRAATINTEYMKDIERQIRKAKASSDILVVLLHIGGQFNQKPGDFSTYMMDKMCDFGADIIIGNHPHTVQRIENREGKIVAYSLGGYCMSVSGEYLVHECLPEYSLALHVDIDEKNKSFAHSVDVLKGTEDERGYLKVAKADENDSGVKTIKERCYS